MVEKRKRLTLGAKVRMINECEDQKLSVREAAARFRVGKTQISEILKKTIDLLKLYVRNGNVSLKIVFPKNNNNGEIIDKATYEWSFRARSHNIPISGTLLQEKALRKSRITVMLCVNMTGDFECPLIIGNAKNPRCFKGVDVKSLKMTWVSNKTAWMTKPIMTDFLVKFDKKMRVAKRKVLLFLDNAASHPDDMKFTNIKLIFLSPNTTSCR